MKAYLLLDYHLTVIRVKHVVLVKMLLIMIYMIVVLQNKDVVMVFVTIIPLRHVKVVSIIKLQIINANQIPMDEPNAVKENA